MRILPILIFCLLLALPLAGQGEDFFPVDPGYWPNPYPFEFEEIYREFDASETLNCGGFVGESPDIVINWSGTGQRLQFSVISETDTALFVEGPGNQFYCVWDAYGQINPVVDIVSAVPGAYRVWIATQEIGQVSGTLYLTQFRRQ